MAIHCLKVTKISVLRIFIKLLIQVSHGSSIFAWLGHCTSGQITSWNPFQFFFSKEHLQSNAVLSSQKTRKTGYGCCAAQVVRSLGRITSWLQIKLEVCRPLKADTCTEGICGVLWEAVQMRRYPPTSFRPVQHKLSMQQYMKVKPSDACIVYRWSKPSAEKMHNGRWKQTPKVHDYKKSWLHIYTYKPRQFWVLVS